jgi:hypothetical protein
MNEKTIPAEFCTSRNEKGKTFAENEREAVGMAILGIAVATVFAENNNSNKANENAPAARPSVLSLE